MRRKTPHEADEAKTSRKPKVLEGEPGSQRVARKRSDVIWLIAVVCFLLCAIQLFVIQIIQGPALAEQARVVRTSASSIKAARGSIVDATGQVLAESTLTYHIAVNQRNILEYVQYNEDGNVVGRGPEAAARQLAPLLDMDVSELGGLMLGDSTYQYLARNVDQDIYREIRSLDIYGIEWEPVYERVYPQGNTAATVIGSVNSEGQGNGGLELTFDELLTGEDGEESYEIGPSGAIIPGAKVTSKEAVSGATIHTSLHADLQSFVQDYLDEAVETYDADWGAAVILEISTSRVLVLADSGEESPEEGPQTSRAVQMVFEPGSVGKLLTFATALEKGTIAPETVLTVPDTYTTEDGEVITDLHEHVTYQRTATGVLVESSNTGTVIIGLELSDEERYETMRALGLGQTTGIELPGESAGLLYKPENWEGRARYITMFGQGYAITALQEAALVATIGNGGVYVAPRVVDGWTNADGTYEEAEDPTPVQAISEETAQELLTMMESVTQDTRYGTGSGAAVEGYRTAVKTGTAELTSGGTVATVAGVVAADDPSLAIAVVLYNPRSGVLSSDSAAPLFKDIATEAVRNLGIPASSEESDLYSVVPGE